VDETHVGLREEAVAGCIEHGDESLDLKKEGKFFSI
jgi:hypothetical protein